MEDETLNFDDLLNGDHDEVHEEPLLESQESETSNESGNEAETKEAEELLPDYSSNPLYTFLQSRGIKDPSKIVLTNEDGSNEEIDFATLTPEEQLDIMYQVTDPGLTEDEYSTINYLRRANMNLGQLMEAYAKHKLDEYLAENPDGAHQKTYTIDDYSDEELYMIDLKRRYPDFSDEEILSKLDEAKRNETLFNKETEILRNTYKAQEDQAEAERVQREQQQVEDLRTNLMNAASNFNEIQLDYTDDTSESLVIEDADKQQMISYILDQDADGKSQLVKDLENPDALIELAWLKTQAADVLSNVTKYWKEMLATERAENKKLRSQLEKVNKKNESAVVIPRPLKTSESKEVYSAWDNSGLL